jgi:hypothetical protein
MSKFTLVLLPLTAIAIGAQPADTAFADAFAKGKVSLNARLRYEHAEQTGLRDSNALTLRTRLGFTTAPINGFKAMIEAEDVTAADGDSYNQGGLNVPGAGAGRVAIADPEGTEINQAYLAYSSSQFTAIAGRQRLVLDNARFIGDVGWRQDQQTYDAVSLAVKPVNQLALTYGYLWQINRIFSNKLDWDSDSHVFNASYGALPIGTLTGYAYLLDFDNAAPNSSATYGLSLVGARPVADGVKVLYRAEYATQSDYGSSALSYDTDYYVFELGVALKTVTLKAGYEVLGSDNNVGFKTPLATLHAFNGWADLFLGTPAAGLEDVYVSATTSPVKGLSLTAMYHWFEAEATSADYGTELDFVASYAINKQFTVLAKYASFDTKSAAFRDTDKVTFEVTFAY